jgi:hypothetical protein
MISPRLFLTDRAQRGLFNIEEFPFHTQIIGKKYNFNIIYISILQYFNVLLDEKYDKKSINVYM